jgi:hypothetical protein
MRLGRRDILTRRNAVKFTALIGASALRQPIADPDVMIDQLQKVLEASKKTNITIQIMPVDAGFHPGLLGPFALLRCVKANPIVHLEHYRSSAFIFEDEDVAAYIEAAQAVAEIAMSPAESARLIAEVIQETETR